MTGFRELVHLLKNYAADELIKVLDASALQHLHFFASATPAGEGIYDASTITKIAAHDPVVDTTSKKALQTQLWNTLFFLDVNQEELEAPDRVAYLCWQRLSVLKTLMGVGAISSLRDIAEPLLQTAKKYELTLVVLETAAHLRQICALHDGNMEGFEAYCRLIETYERILQAEQLAEDHYDAFWFQRTESPTNSGVLAAQAKASVLALQPYVAECPTAAFTLTFRFLQLQAAMLEANWPEVVQICEQASHLLGKKVAVNYGYVSAFLFNQALGLANLGHLEKACTILEKARVEEAVGSQTWFMFHELLLTWYVHQERYVEAWRLFKTLSNHHKNGSWPRERKRLFNAVFIFLNEEHQLRLASRDKGILLLYRMPAWQDQLPECNSDNLDEAATLLLLQLPKWLRKGKSAEIAQRIQHYLTNSGACAPHNQRWITLMEALDAIHNGLDPAVSLECCIQNLIKMPLDYSVPEAAPEIFTIEAIVKIALSTR